jgi:glutamate--cysteine ligase
VPQQGLAATIQGRSLRDMLAIARGLDEALFLDPLDAILATGETRADRWLQRFDRIWDGDSHMMLREAAI